MKKLVSLVLVAALTMGVLSGCSTAGESSGAAGENPTEQEVTVAITSTIDKLDPLFMSTTQMGSFSPIWVQLSMGQTLMESWFLILAKA